MPVPAFDDDYIWVVSDVRARRRRRSGRRRAGRGLSRRRGWRLTAILLTHHHARPRRRSESAPVDAERQCVPVYGPGRQAISDHLTRAPRTSGDRAHIVAPALDFGYHRRARSHERPHRVFPGGRSARHAASCSAATRCSPAAAAGCSKARPRRCWNSLDALAACAGETASLLRARIHAVEHSLRARVRAGQRKAASLARRRDRLCARRQCRRCPRRSRHESAVNPFLRAGERSGSGDARRAVAVTPVSDRLAAFTLMREWKNRFR